MSSEQDQHDYFLKSAQQIVEGRFPDPVTRDAACELLVEALTAAHQIASDDHASALLAERARAKAEIAAAERRGIERAAQHLTERAKIFRETSFNFATGQAMARVYEAEIDAIRALAPSAVTPTDDEVRACVEALDGIFMRVSYVNIHGVGEQPAPTEFPQPIRCSPEEFHRIFQEIGEIAANALSAAMAVRLPGTEG